MDYANASLSFSPCELSPIPLLSTDNAAVETKPHPRILVVDDEPDIRALLMRHLDKLGYECVAAGSAKDAIEQVREGPLDLMISDISMPGMDGIELLREVKRCRENLAVVMITGSNDPLSAINAMKSGADDYILKPFQLADVSRAISSALKQEALRNRIRAFQNDLERMLMERTSQVQRLFLSIVQSLIVALEQKDPYTNGHSHRVAWLSVNLAEATGMVRREIDLVHMAGVFHDLGKIGIHEGILSKTGALTKEEYAHIQTHCDIGVRILEPLQELREILPIVRHHHERYDGRGYPMNLCREKIPFGARILSVADTFDAMLSARPYRSGLTFDEALLRLRQAAGSQLDPGLVDLFIPFAKSEKFRETLRAPFWTLPEGSEKSKSITPDNYPPDILGSFAQIPILKSLSPDYRI